ncbi:hypothetical protein NKH18_26975 [Streptomyces sp. M10(2022)]
MLASSAYHGRTDVSGEIKNRYPDIFNSLLAKRVQTEAESQVKGKAKNDPPAMKKRFSGHSSKETEGIQEEKAIQQAKKAAESALLSAATRPQNQIGSEYEQERHHR